MRAVLERDFLTEFSSERAFRARSYLGLLVAVAIALTLLILQAAGRELDPDRIALYVFRWSALALLASIFLLAPASVVGSVLAERLQQTLLLVLTSPVGPLRFALAKMVARAAVVGGYALSALPPLMVPLLYGGVSGQQVVDLGLVAAGVVLETSAWGLVVSTWSSRLATASVLAYLIPAARWVIMAKGVLPSVFAALGMGWAQPVGPLAAAAASTTPVPGLARALAPDEWASWANPAGGFGLAPGGGGPVFGAGPLDSPGLLYLAAAAVFAALAVVLAGRRLAREAEPRGRVRFDLRHAVATVRGARPGAGSAPARRRPRPGPDHNPVAWREQRLVNTGTSRPLYYGVMAALLLLLVRFVTDLAAYRSRGYSLSPEELPLLLVASSLLLAVAAAAAGAAAVSHERTQGTWDLLRTSPLDAWDIAEGKRAGLLRGLGFLAVVPAGLLVIVVLHGSLTPGGALLAAVLMGLPPLLFAQVGLYLGTRIRRPGLATTAAVMSVVLACALSVGVGNLAHGAWTWTPFPGNPNLPFRAASPYYLVAIGTSLLTVGDIPWGWGWWARGGGEPGFWVIAWATVYAWFAWRIGASLGGRLDRELDREREG